MSGAITAVAVGSYLSNQASNKAQAAAADAAAKAQGYQDAAQQRAIEEQQRQFDLTRQDTATQRQVGDKALNYLSGALQPGGQFAPTQFDPGQYTQSPGYQFQLEQGTQAATNALGAGGMRLSGRAAKELDRYGHGVAAQDYGNWYNRQLGTYQQNQADKQNYLSRQMQLAGIGAQGINTATNAGQNMANQASNIYTTTGANQANIAQNYGQNVGNIQAQNMANINNQIQGGIGNYLAYQQNQKLNNLFTNQIANNSNVSGDAYMPAQYRRW